jgi:SsrA-binding protein
VIAANKKAYHEFTVLAELECGIALVGTEVKSLRAGQCSLQEAFGNVRGGELFLVGAHIPEYAFGNRQNHVPTRERKLLAHKREILNWYKQAREKGITIIPLEIYFDGALVKVRMGLCRGKRLHDKREATRERDHKREMDQAMNRRR